MKHYFLGQASNFRGFSPLKHLFAHGKSSDEKALIDYLAEHYHSVPSQVFLTMNGRSAITMALKSFNLKKHSSVLINGFTCYAVVQAVKAAGFTPVYADIDENTLNFTPEELKKHLKKHNISAIIIQNTLGLPADYRELVSIATENGIRVIEDMAHCVGIHYPSGVEMGTIGDAACLSFGKGKSLDSITGGACILRGDIPSLPARPHKRPRLSDNLRARWYPIFGAIGRFFDSLGVSKYWYGPLIRLHFITRAVDVGVDLTTRPAYWQDKLVLLQLKFLIMSPKPIRTHYLVRDRATVIDELLSHGYNFKEIWYDVPVSPVRYYASLHFPEKECPIATSVSREIINIPTYYDKSELKPALDIIKKYEKGAR